MWETGVLKIDGIRFSYDVKYFDEPSKFGINGGRISKLCIKCGDDIEAMYDREWVTFPKDDVVMNIFLNLIKQFN